MNADHRRQISDPALYSIHTNKGICVDRNQSRGCKSLQFLHVDWRMAKVYFISFLFLRSMSQQGLNSVNIPHVRHGKRCRSWHGFEITDVGGASLRNISIRPHIRRWQACARTFTATMRKPRAYRNACKLWAHNTHARRHAANLPTDPHAKWSPAEPQHQNLRPILNARAHSGGTRCGYQIFARLFSWPRP